jgi:peptide deformylase
MVDLQPEIEGAKVQNHVANFFSSKIQHFMDLANGMWFTSHKRKSLELLILTLSHGARVGLFVY